MRLKLVKEIEESRNDTQACIKEVRIEEDCAICGEKNPEFSLEDIQLCTSCYRNEIYYWSKDDVPRN